MDEAPWLRPVRVDSVGALELLLRERSLSLRALQAPIRLRPPGLGLDACLTGLSPTALPEGHPAGHEEHDEQDQSDHEDGAHLRLPMPNRPSSLIALSALLQSVFPQMGRGNREAKPLPAEPVMSIHIDEVLDWRGRVVVDRDGQKIGTFDEIYLDEGTSEPQWAGVKTGPLGLRRRVVPIAAAQADGEHIRVPFTKAQVKSAPSIDSQGWVPETDQAAIFRHYGLMDSDRGAEPPAESPEPGAGAEAGSTEGGPPANRLRLKRYTVTETLTRRSEFGPD
jgi:hypothetical protein